MICKLHFFNDFMKNNEDLLIGGLQYQQHYETTKFNIFLFLKITKHKEFKCMLIFFLLQLYNNNNFNVVYHNLFHYLSFFSFLKESCINKIQQG